MVLASIMLCIGVLIAVGAILVFWHRTWKLKELLEEVLQTTNAGYIIEENRNIIWSSLPPILSTLMPGDPLERIYTLIKKVHPDFDEALLRHQPSLGPYEITLPTGANVKACLHQISSHRRLWFVYEPDVHSQHLQKKHSLLNEVIEGSPIGIVSVCESGEIFTHNQMFLTMVNKASYHLRNKKPYENLQNTPLFALLHPEKSSDALQKLRLFLQGQKIDKPLEVCFADNERMTMTIYLSAIPHKDNLYTLYFVDSSEHKTLSLQLSQSQKMQAIGQLAGGIAHDFNNLLTAMIGFCDLLLQRHSPGDLSFSDIMHIKQNANRAANLVRQLLAFSRQQTLQPKVVDITDALAELSVLLQRLIGPSINLRVVHARDLWLVKVDHGQLEQVIINLAVNARDAMPEGGRLTIATSNFTTDKSIGLAQESVPPGDYILIKVSDTGIGIPPENLSRIFDPFFSTKEVGAGTGLGLSTVYGIVKQTGGCIAVESQVGIGTTFTIYLPKHVEPQGPEITPSVETPRSADLSGTASVLLVEDEDAVRLFSSRALRDKGYQVRDTNNGPDALQLLEDPGFQCDLLITDVVMAPMDGPTMVKKVLEKRPQIKVIFISGYTEDSFRTELHNNESVHFLPKPFSLKDLAHKVKEVLAG